MTSLLCVFFAPTECDTSYFRRFREVGFGGWGVEIMFVILFTILKGNKENGNAYLLVVFAS